MDNNNTVLPAELQQEVEIKANQYYHNNAYAAANKAYEAGATEYAIWKLKYDELKERYERYEATRHNGVPGFENVYQAAYADACDQWKDKYDALNAENDKLNDANNELMAENHVLSELKEEYEYMKDIKNDYAALKSRAQVLADALKWSLYHTKECQKKHNEFAGPLIEASEQALQSWNQGNEVLGKEGEV